MKGLIAGGLLLFAFAAPALAENSPEDLLRRLTQGAQQGDVRGFVSNLSSASQRELASLEAAETALSRATELRSRIGPAFWQGSFCASGRRRWRSQICPRAAAEP